MNNPLTTTTTSSGTATGTGTARTKTKDSNNSGEEGSFLDNYNAIPLNPENGFKTPSDFTSSSKTASTINNNYNNNNIIDGLNAAATGAGESISTINSNRNRNNNNNNEYDEKNNSDARNRKKAMEELFEPRDEKKEAYLAKKKHLVSIYLEPGQNAPSHQPPSIRKSPMRDVNLNDPNFDLDDNNYYDSLGLETTNVFPLTSILPPSINQMSGEINSTLFMDPMKTHSDAHHTQRYLGNQLIGVSSLVADTRAISSSQGKRNPIMGYPPGLPHINSHLTNDDLKIENISASIRNNRTPAVNLRFAKISREDLKEAEMIGQFSKEDIKNFMKFITSELEDSKGMVTFDALELIFRRLRRTRAAEPFERQGRKLIMEFKDLLLAREMSIANWFSIVDHGATGDGKLTRLELMEGIQGMITKAKFKFTDEELICLIRYMDPNGDESVTFEEITDAFRRSVQDPSRLAFEGVVGKIMEKLESIMDRRRMRLIDLFREFDKDNSGEISMQELMDGIQKAVAPPRSIAKIQKEIEQSELQKKIAEDRIILEKKCNDTFRAARDSGALPIILKLDILLRQKKIQVHQLFDYSLDIDKNGQFSVDEMILFLKKLNLPISRKEVYTIVNYLDKSGDGQVSANEIEIAIRSIRLAQNLMRKKHVKEALKSNESKSERTKTQRVTKLHKLFSKKFTKSMTSESVWRYKEQNLYSVKKIPFKKPVAQTTGYKDWLKSYDNRFKIHQKKLDKNF